MARRTGLQRLEEKKNLEKVEMNFFNFLFVLRNDDKDSIDSSSYSSTHILVFLK